jgi:hypothetical protein
MCNARCIAQYSYIKVGSSQSSTNILPLSETPPATSTRVFSLAQVRHESSEEAVNRLVPGYCEVCTTFAIEIEAL